MKTIQTQIVITEDGYLKLAIPADLTPGEYDAVLILESRPVSTSRLPLELPVIDGGQWSEEISLRREDLYDDKF